MTVKRIKGLVLIASAAPEQSMVSSVRIARFLRDTLRLPLYAWKNHGDLVAADTIFFVNSSTTFNEETYRQFSQEVMRNARKRVIYVQNDYKIAFHTNWKNPAKEAGVELSYWSTIPRVVAAKGGHVVNWNALAYDKLRPITNDRIKNLFYYGACRPERLAVLRERLSWLPDKHVISAPDPRATGEVRRRGVQARARRQARHLRAAERVLGDAVRRGPVLDA
jgi:hypothetical protein